MLTAMIMVMPLAMTSVPMKKAFQKATVTAFLPCSTIPLTPHPILGNGAARRPSFFSAGVRSLRVVGTMRAMR